MLEGILIVIGLIVLDKLLGLHTVNDIDNETLYEIKIIK